MLSSACFRNEVSADSDVQKIARRQNQKGEAYDSDPQRPFRETPQCDSDSAYLGFDAATGISDRSSADGKSLANLVFESRSREPQ
jgi:hypothetical protein